MRQWGRRRILLVLAAALVAVEIVYIVAANVYLNSDSVPRLVHRPEKFSLRWEAAWTVWPGTVHLRDVVVQGSTRKKLDWYVHLDSVAASCRLLPLFKRVVHLRSVSTSGVDYRQRRRSESAEAGEPDLPPIPALRTQPGAVPRAPGSKKKVEPWTIVADDIDADIEQLWFDRYRLSGRMSVQTSMKLVVRGPMEFPRVRFETSQGALTMGDRTILGGLRLDVDTALHAFVPKGVKALDVVRRLSGRYQVHAESASLFFLEEYFKQIPWLRFNGRSAVQADLRIEGGRLRSGSTLETVSEALDVDFLDRKLTGKGRVAVKVEEVGGTPQSHLELLLDEFALAVPGEGEPYARGRGFKVVATSAELDLENPLTALDVVADLPDAVIDDVAFYNRYIPAATGLAIHKGSGHIAYHVEGSSEEKSFRGWIDLAVRDLALQFQSYEILGDVKIHTLLDNPSWQEHRFDISGTTIDLESHKFPWKANIALPKAEVRFSEPIEVGADAEIRMTDTTPLVALFDAQKDVSSFVEKLMTIRNIRGSASLGVNADGSEITDVRIEGENLTALADLALRKTGKEGILYIKFHGFSVGVEFDKGKKDLDLVRARTWFEKERAKRRPHPSGK